MKETRWVTTRPHTIKTVKRIGTFVSNLILKRKFNTFVYCHSNKKEEKVFSTAQTFYVVDCGASGHNIRALPSLKALPVGKLKLGSSFLVTEQVFSMIPLL
jgi:hypothetical protein